MKKLRELNTIQKVEKLNHIFADDSRDNVGGAAHHYVINRTDLSKDDPNYPDYYNIAHIDFQCGVRHDEKSKLGVLDADLLEIVRDRLKGFQSEDFSTEDKEDNAGALEHIEYALLYLNRRYERNVLGTYQK